MPLNRSNLDCSSPCAVAHSPKASYLLPFFTDNNRFAKIQATFPMITQLYKEYAEKNHVPGYAFGVMVDSQLVHSGSGGYADIEKKIPATTQSLFRIASMTKSFTAMALLKLRDEGKLRLDDPVYHYIPEIKNQRLSQDAPEMTIRDLLTHSAGFPEDNPWGDRKLDITDEALIALIKKGLSFSNVPGTTYEYSNLTYAMLGYIIKKIAGVSCQEFIATTIWKPLRMEQAAWEFTKVSPLQLAHGYQWVEDNWKEQELLHDGSFGAMGGMIASIEALSHYVALHQSAWPPRDDAETGPIKRSSIREMQQPWRFAELSADHECATTSAYGYGLAWSRDVDAKVYVGHSGGLPGFGSNWVIMPDYGIGLIFLTNLTYSTTRAINLQVLEAIVKAAQLKPRQLPPSQVLQDRQRALVKLLPDWKGAETSGFFAENFFLDSQVASLKKASRDLFTKAGHIIQIGEVIPENQLRGHFIVGGEKINIKISFTLTPENPALIQKYQIEEIEQVFPA